MSDLLERHADGEAPSKRIEPGRQAVGPRWTCATTCRARGWVGHDADGVKEVVFAQPVVVVTKDDDIAAGSRHPGTSRVGEAGERLANDAECVAIIAARFPNLLCAKGRIIGRVIVDKNDLHIEFRAASGDGFDRRTKPRGANVRADNNGDAV